MQISASSQQTIGDQLEKGAKKIKVIRGVTEFDHNWREILMRLSVTCELTANQRAVRYLSSRACSIITAHLNSDTRE